VERNAEIAGGQRGLGTVRTKTFLLLVSLFAAALQSPPAGPDALHTRSEMLVNTAWLSDHLHDPNLIIVCVAANDDFCTAGHIPGARLLRLHDIAVTRNGIPNELPSLPDLQAVFERIGLSNGSRIVLYGERSGLFAARGYFTLDYLGLGDRAALLDGGFEKWKAEHRAQSTDLLKITPSRLELHPNPAVLLDAAAVLDLTRATSGSPRALLVDARPPDEYSGAKFSEDVSQSGHIPGAVGLYWMDTLDSHENPVLRPIDELRAMYTRIGAAPERDIVNYCRTGMQSSFDYFVAKYLGYKASMYDGSFFEWSRKDLPVKTSATK
jgi:thiosulfate/3-mercaptopyruvate sulfurtransferase